jgi:hypothetical protein
MDEVKREAGANPARSRHCKAAVASRKPGDLPVCMMCLRLRGKVRPVQDFLA